MNRNQNFKTLDEKKKELASLRAEWEKMVEQEKELKEKFKKSPFEQKKEIKRQLTSLQREIFDKGHCGRCQKGEIKKEEWVQKLKNPTGPATDPGILASQIKEELKAILNGSRKMETGDTVGDIWEANHGQEFCYFGSNKEVKEAIANLLRKRKEPLDPDKITTRMVRVKRKDLSATDFDEIISLIRQTKNFLEEKDKQDREQTEQIKQNNPHLFTQWKCSTDGKYNGRGGWENWHTFSGKHNGFNYTIYVPDNHIALTNCLFNDGWGTNSEVSKFFVVEGAAKPTELHYWNVAQQRDEIISEAEARKLTKKDKDYYINYKTYVDINDKISIRHYDEKSDKLELAKPVSGANKELDENNNQQIMSGGSIANEIESLNPAKEIDTEFLLKYFQDHDIKQISLTSEGKLLIEYNNGQTKISEKTNNQELQKVIGYYQKNGQTNLSQQDLINLQGTNSSTGKNSNNSKLLTGIGLGIGGALIIGAVIGILVRKQKIKIKK